MAGIKVAVSGKVMSKGGKMSKAGKPYGEVRIGWMDAGDAEGRGASAGMYTCRCDIETMEGCEVGSDVTMVATGREKDWKIDVGFFEAKASPSARAKAA